MSKVLHVISRSNGIGRDGLHPTDNEGEWISESWVNLGVEPSELVGGWIFLHEKRTETSVFGGKVLEAFESVRPENKTKSGTDFRSKYAPECRGIAWRGKGVRRGHGGIISVTDGM